MTLKKMNRKKKKAGNLDFKNRLRMEIGEKRECRNTKPGEQVPGVKAEK